MIFVKRGNFRTDSHTITRTFGKQIQKKTHCKYFHNSLADSRIKLFKCENAGRVCKWMSLPIYIYRKIIKAYLESTFNFEWQRLWIQWQNVYKITMCANIKETHKQINNYWICSMCREDCCRELAPVIYLF